MTYYVGWISPLGGLEEDQDGMVAAEGYYMDAGVRMRFRAPRETLERYLVDDDPDAFIMVPHDDVTWCSKRCKGELWSVSVVDQQPS